MLLLFLVPAFAGSMTFVWEHLTLIPSISAYSLVLITLSAFLILALSSLSKSRWFVAVMYAGLAFFTHAVFGVSAPRSPARILLGFHLRQRQSGRRRVVSNAAPVRHASAHIRRRAICVVVAGSAAVLSRRIRAVEVVT